MSKNSRYLSCIYCNNNFYSKLGTAKFCSSLCSGRDLRLKNNCKKINIKINCKECGKDFTKKSHNHLYCKKECLLKEYEREKKKGNYQGHYLKLRFKILKRDNFTCSYCGRNVKEDKIKLQADHIIPKSKGGNDDEDNLITSCYECNFGKRDVLIINNIDKNAKNR